MTRGDALTLPCGISSGILLAYMGRSRGKHRLPIVMSLSLRGDKEPNAGD